MEYINIKDEKDVLECLNYNLRFKDLPFEEKLKKGLYWTGWFKSSHYGKIALIYWFGLVKLKARWDLVAWGVKVNSQNQKKVVKLEVINNIQKCLSEGIWKHKGKKYQFSEWLPEVQDKRTSGFKQL